MLALGWSDGLDSNAKSERERTKKGRPSIEDDDYCRFPPSLKMFKHGDRIKIRNA